MPDPLPERILGLIERYEHYAIRNRGLAMEPGGRHPEMWLASAKQWEEVVADLRKMMRP